MMAQDFDEEFIPMDDQPAKPLYIHEQHNHSCQQFFGKVTHCVFAMPGATVNQQPAHDAAPAQTSAAAPKADGPKVRQAAAPRKPRQSQPKPVKEHGVAHDTFLRGRFVTDSHLNVLLHVMQQEGWIGNTTSASQFRALFSGKSSGCEIVWTGGGTGNLKELFRTLQEEQLIALPAGTRSVNSVLENHVVDEKGNFIADLNRTRPAVSAFQTIAKYVAVLKARLDTDGIQADFDGFGSTFDPAYR